MPSFLRTSTINRLNQNAISGYVILSSCGTCSTQRFGLRFKAHASHLETAYLACCLVFTGTAEVMSFSRYASSMGSPNPLGVSLPPVLVPPGAPSDNLTAAAKTDSSISSTRNSFATRPRSHRSGTSQPYRRMFMQQRWANSLKFKRPKTSSSHRRLKNALNS